MYSQNTHHLDITQNFRMYVCIFYILMCFFNVNFFIVYANFVCFAVYSFTNTAYVSAYLTFVYMYNKI
jgi:hypothetical protein